MENHPTNTTVNINNLKQLMTICDNSQYIEL